MIKYIKIKDWEFVTYDKLIFFLKDKYSFREVKKIIDDELENLEEKSQNEIKNIVDLLGDISIFKSKINLPQMKDKYYCQFVNLYGLKISIKEKYEKTYLKKINTKLLSKLLTIFIFNELNKFFKNNKYIEALNTFKT